MPLFHRPGADRPIIKEADKLKMPESLLNVAADLAATVIDNTYGDNAYTLAAPLASYLVKYAYILNQSGQLVEAPPKPKQEKKQKRGDVA